MAGKFINKSYTNMIDSLVTVHDDLLNNPFYAFNDKKGTKVKYYNMNTEKTTIDEGSKLAYTDLGSNSPIRFNVIYDLFLYQFIKAELNLENGDFGLEGNPITGESFILPNVIVPIEGDFFEVDHIKDSTWLFKVTDVQRDTLENGSNVFRISWSLDRTTNKEILENVVEEYQYINVQEGTNTKAVVKLEKYKIAEKLDSVATTLRKYFYELFYSSKVQTFIYPLFNNSNMYDPFATEFIIRNRLLEDAGDGFVYIEHKLAVPVTFTIDYNKSIYYAFEQRNIDKLKLSAYQSQAKFIDSPISIFNTRYEDYYELDYKVYMNENNEFNVRSIIPILSEDLMEHITGNIKYEEDKDKYKNIFVKYFNREDIYSGDVESIEYIDFAPVKDIYYHTLLLIFCIDFYTKTLLS